MTTQEVERLALEVYGLVPPSVKEMMETSAEVAYQYMSGLQVLQGASLSETEQHAVQLKISLLNKCNSCITGHSYLLKKAGMPNDDILSIRHNLLTSDARLNRLLDLTTHLFTGGREGFSQEIMEQIQATQTTRQQVLEVIGLLAVKTLSNYINNYSLASRTFKPATA